MKPNTRIILVLAAALVVAGVVFRQEKEMYRLRAVIAGLTSLPREGAAVSAVTNSPPADIEELRREVAEVHRLRAEITQLRRETSALQARIDKNLSAILGNLNQRSDSVADIGDFNDPAPITSPLVLQASSLAQSWPEEAARWAAALPPGKEYAAWMSPSGTRQRPLDSLRQFTVTQSSHVLVAAEIKSVEFMAIEKTGAPFAGSARCSLLGEA